MLVGYKDGVGVEGSVRPVRAGIVLMDEPW